MAPYFKSRKSINFLDKLLIIKEAYDGRDRIKPTAKKYGIRAHQIKSWKRKFDALHRQLDDPDTDEDTTRKIQKTLANKANSYRFEGAGRPPLLPDNVIKSVKTYFDTNRAKNLSVSCQQLMATARNEDTVSLCNVPRTALKARIHRLLSNWDITWRRGTHVAQNTRLSEDVMSDFRTYVIERLYMLGIKPSNVYNADQTNVRYSMPSLYTYAKKGSSTVAILGSASANRCSVMLGVSWLGDKLPPFVVFKGSTGPYGRVMKEIAKGEGYPEGLLLSVQKKRGSTRL